MGGDAEAQFKLGVIYLDSDGAWGDDEEAAKWFRLAAEHGHPGAIFSMGEF